MRGAPKALVEGIIGSSLALSRYGLLVWRVVRRWIQDERSSAVHNLVTELSSLQEQDFLYSQARTIAHKTFQHPNFRGCCAMERLHCARPGASCGHVFWEAEQKGPIEQGQVKSCPSSGSDITTRPINPRSSHRASHTPISFQDVAAPNPAP